MSQRPEIIKKIRKEIKDVIMDGNTDVENIEKYITYDKIQSMEYTSMCVKEALRIDPPTTHIPYVTKKTIEFNGVKLFKGNSPLLKL